MGEPLCVVAAGKLLVIAASTFTLSWTHSVEKITWWEEWRTTPAGLELVLARVQGAGAGMEAPAGAQKVADGWEYRPSLPIVPRLVLAASGATPSGWTLCAGGSCRELGADAGPPIVMWPASMGTCDPPQP